VSHRTLSGFRSENKTALNDLFAQVLGMLSAEGLITLERVTLDGSKIKANAGGNTLRRQEKLAAHLVAAREQVRLLNEQAEREEQLSKRQAAARRRAARQRASRLEAAVREVERLPRERVHERKTFVARASSSDPEAHVMRNGEGGTVPRYNVQLLTDTQHGLVVNVKAPTDAIDYRQLDAALTRCQEQVGGLPQQVIADGDYTNHASVQAAAARGVDFYGSWQNSWRATERDACGRRGAFVSSAFVYDAERDCFTCPAGEKLLRRRAAAHASVSRTATSLLRLRAARPMRAAGSSARVAPLDHAARRTPGDRRVQSQDEDGSRAAHLRATLAHCGVRTRLDQRTLRPAAVSLSRATENHDGSHLGLLELQRHALLRSAASTVDGRVRGRQMRRSPANVSPFNSACQINPAVRLDPCSNANFFTRSCPHVSN